MNIDKTTLHKIAHLARLEVKPEQEEKVMADITNMIQFVEKLKEVNTDGVEPLTTMSHEINNLREDQVDHELPHDRALQNAPKKDDSYFRVPKVID